jgi:hypothetical protein
VRLSQQQTHKSFVKTAISYTYILWYYSIHITIFCWICYYQNWLQIYSYSGCLEKSFTMLFQILLSGVCYENVYTLHTVTLEYHCKAVFVTPYITSGSHIEPWLSQLKLDVFCYIMTVQNTAHVIWINLYKLPKLQSFFCNILYWHEIFCFEILPVSSKSGSRLSE